MDKSNVTVGRHYAVREHAGDELEHVRVLESVRSGKWRVEWVSPNAGLVDFVRSRDIIIEWGQRRALLRDERAGQLLAECVERSSYPGPQHPLTKAVESVLDAASEPSVWLHQGVLTFKRDGIARMAARVGVPAPEHPTGYADRNGWCHLPWSCALELAEAFARNEPATVLEPIDAEEREWSVRSREPGEQHLVRLLTGYRAVWAIVRQWASHDAAIALREARIRELEDLLVKVMWDLRRPGADGDRIAARIDRAMRGR
jgi:hypothetical protein